MSATPSLAQGRAPFQPPAQIQTPAPAPAPTPVPQRPKPAVAATPAQTPAAVAAPGAAATPQNEPPPPYEPQLLRLAEMMGALSYLRDLCRAGDGPTFRDKFAQLLEIEAHSQERKEALAGAFNRGFEDYELTYRACTASAHETIANYLEETQRIARDVATRYGG
jgi:uncharacterized protein (TIGR02301 family)